ncbi:hypothetical protein [Coraliomargarita parva]|uniref:hypothetical protein n=1 Tax=Coraliomargarita parva TaxID=3014050 RepID=UPI0022B39F42|nr:hypothetical protein [Coraliomargarita parva]
MKYVLFLSSCLCLLFFGCASPENPNGNFVRSVDFTPFDTFSFKHTLITGFDWNDSETLMLEQLSEQVLTQELEARGFESVESGSDFYVVVKWMKGVSSYPSVFDSIDGPLDSLNRRENPSYRFAARLNLTVEVYETETRSLFWRKDLPNIFDAVQLTSGRVQDSLSRAIQHFPDRVDKDPDLPSLQGLQ